MRFSFTREVSLPRNTKSSTDLCLTNLTGNSALGNLFLFSAVSLPFSLSRPISKHDDRPVDFFFVFEIGIVYRNGNADDR